MPRFPSAQGRLNHEPDSTLAVTKTCPKDGVHLYHRALRGLEITRTGQPGSVGTLVTQTLLIAGDPRVHTTPTGQQGAMLRAYDKATGAEVGALFIPAPQTGSPMTYALDGDQYLVVAISGGGYSGELVAFRLPDA